MSSIARFDTWQAADGTNVARYNAGTLEVWNGTAWAEPGPDAIRLEYIVVAGGGGGGNARGGGGGAGGYRSSVSGEETGGDGRTGGALPAEPNAWITPGTSLTVTVGAGGSASNDGSDSRLGGVLSSRGRQGGDGGQVYLRNPGGSGGGAGGGANNGLYGTYGMSGHGQKGGEGKNAGQSPAAGGGGAGVAGANVTSTSTGTDGGDGIQSSIDGTPTYRAGGGGGSCSPANGSTVPGSGGLGGGGNGGNGTTGGNGTANTGGGGGGGGNSANGGLGGSGVVIFRVPTGTSVSFSGGVTSSSASITDWDVYTVTATSTTSETVTIG